MWTWKKTGWTMWLVVDVLLLAHLTVWPDALYPLLAVLAVQTALYAWRDRSPITFPVQLRGIYLLIVCVGLLPGFGFLNWLQLMGTTVYLTFSYCLLARLIVLLPWNRAVGLSGAVVRAALLTPPNTDCIVHVVNDAGARSVPTREPGRELKEATR